MPAVLPLAYALIALVGYKAAKGGNIFGKDEYLAIKRLIEGPPDPQRAPLEVAINDTGQAGFAIYGTVRVSGTNVIPPC